MTSSHASNRLAHATSPYLLQHANNPVDWFEWGHEALTRAKQEDKPILLSIGYSSCHWCHVMAHESFENEDIAQLMNEYFVCIKLDREERPDIDQIYMEAVQAMGQNGGWPLNVFLTPDQKPFFGGTYFPPKNWAQLLVQINKAFREKRNEINESANDLSKHLAISDLQRFKNVPSSNGLNSGALDAMHQVIESRFDFNEGGLDKAPKFIMPSIWLFLLRYYHLQKNPKTLEMLHLTLKKIAAGGIYDQIGGGFARYSVDGQWFAPHFEKMLYDNGQLLSLYAEAYRLTKEPVYARIIRETVAWLEREMTSPEGGFYSALDADSEGEEGKFYTWQFNELKELNAEEIQLLTDHYHITPEGN
ncbi:MAG: thioredoxin domain-containing protein, partial [Cyclobacteriaceae bacterium]